MEKLSLHERFLKIQEDMPVIKKDIAHPHFKGRKYADINGYIEMIKPILTKHGVHVMQLTEVTADGNNVVRTVATCDGPNGVEKYEAAIGIGKYADPQKLGSEITYVRRYMIQCMFFAQAEDDDADSFYDRKPAAPTSSAPAASGQQTYKPKWKREG